MARSKIADVSSDLQTDTGNVLWSFIRGEQLEFPLTLNFLTNADSGYTFEAVVIEAANVSGEDAVPSSVQPAGDQTTLVVRIPPEKGIWSALTAYTREDVVSYGGLYYKLSAGTARVDAATPDTDPLWEEYVPNKLYIQFPETLSITPAYATEPTPLSKIRGFFELRVTEPAGGIYQRTWKPFRGVVEMAFSPTHLVT